MNTREKILDISKALIQKNGANGFSYQDIADKLKIKKASIHYHFPQKNDLLLELIQYYSESLKGFLADIDSQELSFKKKFELYLTIYRELAEGSQQICLCGTLAGEIMTLPKNFKKEITAFFDIHEEWLEKLFGEAKKNKELKKNPKLFAKEALAALQGALIISRLKPDSRFMNEVIESLIAS